MYVASTFTTDIMHSWGALRELAFHAFHFFLPTLPLLPLSCCHNLSLCRHLNEVLEPNCFAAAVAIELHISIAVLVFLSNILSISINLLHATVASGKAASAAKWNPCQMRTRLWLQRSRWMAIMSQPRNRAQAQSRWFVNCQTSFRAF